MIKNTMNKEKAIRKVSILICMIFLAPAHALQVAGYTFKYAKTEGMLIHWFPEKQVTHYKIFRNDSENPIAILEASRNDR